MRGAPRAGAPRPEYRHAETALVFAALLLALGVNVGMLALSAALLSMMIRWFVVARGSRTAG